MCKIVDCKIEVAQNECPITCRKTKEPELCKVADCSKPEAFSLCPNKCGSKKGNRQVQSIKYSSFIYLYVNYDVYDGYIKCNV